MPGPREYTAEFLGTLLLLLFGLSAVTVNFAAGSPVPDWIPDENVRRLLTGLLFAGGATAIVYSPLGRTSGGHINPAVTLGFFRVGKLRALGAAGYVTAQVAGALGGAVLVRLLWGTLAERVNLGVTEPGIGGPVVAFLAETAITFALMTLILQFVDRPRLMAYTAAVAGSFVAMMVFLAAPVSGTSLNPARSLGPAVVTGSFTWVWIYLLAPPIGAFLAATLHRRTLGEVKCGKLFHDNRYACRFLGCRYRPGGEAATEQT